MARHYTAAAELRSFDSYRLPSFHDTRDHIHKHNISIVVYIRLHFQITVPLNVGMRAIKYRELLTKPENVCNFLSLVVLTSNPYK